MTEPLGHSATAPASTCPKTQTCVAPTVGVGVGVRDGVRVDVTAAEGDTVCVGVWDGVCVDVCVGSDVGVADTAAAFAHSVPGSSGLPEQSTSSASS